eukprot:2544484-Amphidinium_carterae.1
MLSFSLEDAGNLGYRGEKRANLAACASFQTPCVMHDVGCCSNALPQVDHLNLASILECSAPWAGYDAFF